MGLGVNVKVGVGGGEVKVGVKPISAEGEQAEITRRNKGNITKKMA